MREILKIRKTMRKVDKYLRHDFLGLDNILKRYKFEKNDQLRQSLIMWAMDEYVVKEDKKVT